ncbi:unnamed protein product [Mytilus edulis]|uniref:C2H2-type domain-containing protein n=1 Tax=Mytilus edulis TaxID=6550 RepID=A0A8S3R6N3_MYTED|nr:unnamed protein product [Mytilus edulis]
MRPSSQIEVKCWLCPMTFRTRRQLKNHLAAAPHKRLSVVCVWCPEEKSYRRMVDLKEHMMANHRSKIEFMPYSFLSKNNGFWMSNYPETYAKVILPFNENSQEATKARIEVLEFLNRVENTNRKKEDWTLGWKCPKEMVRSTQEEEVEPEKTNGSYSPTRPIIYEGLALQQLTLGLGDSTAIFKLDLGVSIRFYQINLNDLVLRDHKMVDALIRRITALVNIKYAGSHTFSISIDGKLKSIVTPVVARKLSISEEYITDIKTSDELFPGKQTKAVTNPLSPLRTPSTSDIILEDDSDNEEPEILEKATSQKKEKHNEESKRRELEASEDQGEDCITLIDNITARERTRKILRKGGMPLFPAGRREWNQEEVIPLITIPAVVSWPPQNWKKMTQKLSNGSTKTATGSEENTMATQSGFYLYQALAYIIKSDKEDSSTVHTLKMLETAVKERDNSTDDVIKRIDDLDIPLRL